MSIITLTVIYCLVLNGYICRTLEMVPQDGHEIVSIPECNKGGAIGSMQFTLDHMEWRTKGWKCIERQNPMQTWLQNHPSIGD